MTWSLTLAELPRAGANSKPDHHKQKVQKTKDIPKTCVLMGKQFEDLRQKRKQNHYSRPFRKTPWNTRLLKTTIEYGFNDQ